MVAPMVEEQLLTVRDVAEQLKLHPETVRNWLREGRLRGTQLGGTKAGWRIPPSEVRRIVAEGFKAANAPDGAQ